METKTFQQNEELIFFEVFINLWLDYEIRNEKEDTTADNHRDTQDK